MLSYGINILLLNLLALACVVEGLRDIVESCQNNHYYIIYSVCM